jgi:hypothetical protein
MGHEPHPHDHDHHHAPGSSATPAPTRPALDPSIPDDELPPGELDRRAFLRRAGLLGAAGAAIATGSVFTQPAVAADGGPSAHPARGGYRWLAGDHHTHTQYSPDGVYRVQDQVAHAAAYGLDWLVITDHGSVAHAKIGVERIHPDILEARDTHGDEVLVFQGLEWNIPAAEHGTVFVHPGRHEVDVLKEFENSFDGTVNGWGEATAANEWHALEGLAFLATSVTRGAVPDALFLANHPARRGVDSPHEIRGWRDEAPTVAIGMEGAPGHQAAAFAQPYGPGAGRGYYDNAPGPNSFPGYPPESYLTWGGFDWMTARVGGLWDSLLAEGRPWWITANSDAHWIYLDQVARGPGSDFARDGYYQDPVHGGATPGFGNGDFWPGYYSRTHVGAARFSYAGLMQGMRAGRMWVDHGGLVDHLDVQVRQAGTRALGGTLGDVVHVRRGATVELVVTVRPASRANWAQFVPRLATVDVIAGPVTGPAADRDTISAPGTRVVKTFDVSGVDGRTGEAQLVWRFRDVAEPFYLRLRGSDGHHRQPGPGGAGVDPAGPRPDPIGQADPWDDLWFYTNPVWVLPQR